MSMGVNIYNRFSKVKTLNVFSDRRDFQQTIGYEKVLSPKNYAFIYTILFPYNIYDVVSVMNYLF